MVSRERSKPAASIAGASAALSKSMGTKRTWRGSPPNAAATTRCFRADVDGWSTSKTTARAMAGIRYARASNPAPRITTCPTPETSAVWTTSSTNRVRATAEVRTPGQRRSMYARTKAPSSGTRATRTTARSEGERNAMA